MAYVRRSVERDSLLLPTAQHRHLDELYRQLSLGKRQRKREVRLVPASWPSRRDPHRKCRSAGRFPAQADKRTRYPILARYPKSEHHMRRRIRKVLGLDLPRFRGEMRAWIRLSGFTSCYPPVPGILWFGPRRSHSSVPKRTKTQRSDARSYNVSQSTISSSG